MGFLFGEGGMDTKPFTLQELVLLALPVETRVVTGNGRLECHVTWIVSASAVDRSAKLAGGDLAFLLPPYTNDLASRLTEIARAGAAGVVVLGEPGDAVAQAAEKIGVPLLALTTTLTTPSSP